MLLANKDELKDIGEKINKKNSTVQSNQHNSNNLKIEDQNLILNNWIYPKAQQSFKWIEMEHLRFWSMKSRISSLILELLEIKVGGFVIRVLCLASIFLP